MINCVKYKKRYNKRKKVIKMKEKKTYPMGVKITETMKKELDKICEEEKRDFSDLVRYMLQNEIDEYRKWGKKKRDSVG